MTVHPVLLTFATALAMDLATIVCQVHKFFLWSQSFGSQANIPSREPPLQDDIPEVFRMERCKSHDLFEISIERLQQLYANKSLTIVDYAEYCIDRILAVDSYLEAVIQLNPDAVDIAKELDRERRAGKSRGPLHGIPVLVKDNIATKDSMETTAGSWALLGSVVPRDAHIVTLLRQSGAVIIGHSSMTEWASLRSRSYSDGYSPRRGQVRNPYYLSRSPFGSSGGSAVAVAANMVPLAFGTETDGSVIGPAQINGVVGIKPTPGLTSRSGVIPTSYTMDTVGTMGRTVADAVAGLSAISGVDPKDALTMVSSRRQEVDYTAFLTNRSALQGAKFGLPIKRCWEFVTGTQREVAETMISLIKEAGAEIHYVDYPCAEERIAENGKWDWELGGSTRSEYSVIKVEAYNGMNQYLSELSGTPVKTFEDIVDFNIENYGTEGAFPGDHPAFPTGQDIFDEILETRGVESEEYHSALRYIQHKSRVEGIDAALDIHEKNGGIIELDALILSDRRLVGQQMAAQAGYPTICIPIGIDDDGLPVALTLQQKAWKEGILIKWASALEDLRNYAVGTRPTPKYKDCHAKNIPIGRKHVPRICPADARAKF